MTTHSRLRFPRKAAFFSLVAAEAMARQADENADAARRASSLYLAATRLYTRRGNACVHGEEGEPTRYGWATLRIGALRGLSTQPADKELAEAGALPVFLRVTAALLPHLSPLLCVSDGTSRCAVKRDFCQPRTRITSAANRR